MKKGETLLEAFGNIDDKYIIECDKIKEKNNVIDLRDIFRMKNLTKVVGGAACLVLLVTGGVILNRKNPNSITNPDFIQIANPFVELDSLEELQKYFKEEIPVLNKDVKLYTIISDKQGYANHARIMYADGSNFEMEYGKDNDVSGISGGKFEREEIINGINVKFYLYSGIDNEIYYAIWSKDNYSYSYSSVGEEVAQSELSLLIE